MKRSLAAAALLAAAGTALPQQANTPAPDKEASQPQPQQAPAKKPMLNLRLDDAGKFGTQSEAGAADSLPGLGGTPKSTSREIKVQDKNPFPKDTNPTR